MGSNRMAGQSKKILLVDDDHFILALLAKLLGEAGYQTAQAENGERALDMLEAGAFDLVITDIIMPGKNGIELASYIKKNHGEIPVLAISSNFDAMKNADTLGLTSYFADDSLAKPFQKDDLLFAVRSLLANCSALSLYG